MPTALVKGGNVLLAQTGLTGPFVVTLTWARKGDLDPDVTALILTDGKVRSDPDMVFRNQPDGPDDAHGAVRYLGKGSGGLGVTDRVRIDPARLPAGVNKVAVSVSLDEGLGVLGPFRVEIAPEHAPDTPTVTYTVADATSETAMVAVEVYEHTTGWKARAVGQGWTTGLAGLATDFGIVIDQDPEQSSAPVLAATAVPATAAPEVTTVSTSKPRVSFTKGEDRLPVDMRKKLNLRKALVADALERRGALGIRARVVLVFDVSRSTHNLYASKVFHRAAEQVAPVAAQVDDGAEMQAFVMGGTTHRLPDLMIGGMPRWLELHLRTAGAGGAGKKGALIEGQIDMRAIRASNNEAEAMRVVCEYTRTEPLDIPTLVLFFHDGGVTDNAGVKAAVRGSVEAPIFWQFIGIGKSNYGILEKLDTLAGRRIDNTGFFALDDIDKVTDEDLYRLLLHEFPDWVRAYYPVGHPARAHETA